MRTVSLVTVVAAFFFASSGAPLKVSLPPLFGAVPIVMGVTWGLFQEEGVEVELVPLPSQRDRMIAFQAGQVDVMVTDLTGALLLVSTLPNGAVIAGTAYVPDLANAHLALVTPVTYSKIATWDELLARIRGGGRVQIALPRQSDLEFVVDELFRSQGLSVSPDLYIGQDNLLVNASWTLLGMVAVGALPQPYVDYILNYSFEGKPTLQALQWVAGGNIPPDVIVFRRSLVESQPELVASFFRALRRTVHRLNAEEREELVTTVLPIAVDMFFPGGLPQAAQPEDQARVEAAIAAIAIPAFSEPGPVDPDVYGRVMAWAVNKGYLRSPIPYDAAVVPPPG
ncbi:MAG: hypothetical protein ABID40_03365 [Candidatus Bipolaricaulota bacterium]